MAATILFSIALCLVSIVIYLQFQLTKNYWTDVENVFLASEVTCQNDRFFLNRQTAILVKELPKNSKNDNLVSRIYKNDYGEYFLYIGNHKRSTYFSHISLARAKQALIIFKSTYQQEFGDT